MVSSLRGIDGRLHPLVLHVSARHKWSWEVLSLRADVSAPIAQLVSHAPVSSRLRLGSVVLEACLLHSHSLAKLQGWIASTNLEMGLLHEVHTLRGECLPAIKAGILELV